MSARKVRGGNALGCEWVLIGCEWADGDAGSTGCADFGHVKAHKMTPIATPQVLGGDLPDPSAPSAPSAIGTPPIDQGGSGKSGSGGGHPARHRARMNCLRGTPPRTRRLSLLPNRFFSCPGHHSCLSLGSAWALLSRAKRWQMSTERIGTAACFRRFGGVPQSLLCPFLLKDAA